MEKLYRFFPLSASVQPGDLRTALISVVIYLTACAILGVVQMILGWIPLVGTLLRLVCSLLGLYCVGGIVLSILRYSQNYTSS